MLKRLMAAAATLMAALTLTSCGTGAFPTPTPTGNLVVTFNPDDARPETIIWGPNYQQLGKFAGDFTTTAPAGQLSLTVRTPGYENVTKDVTLAAGQTTRVDIPLVKSLVVTYSWGSITRYTTATMTLTGLIAKNYSGTLSLRAACVEDGYPSLTTSLRGQVSVAAGESTTAHLIHSGGFPYFTDNAVRCSLYAEAPGRQEVRILQR